eukprot:gene15214-32228_t
MFDREGRLQRERSVNERGNSHGRVAEFWPNGQVRREETADNGRPQGAVRRFDASGRVERVSFHGEGQELFYVEYTSKGQPARLLCPRTSVLPEDRKLCGFDGATDTLLFAESGARSAQLRYDQGRLLSATEWTADGIVSAQQLVVDGRRVHKSFTTEGGMSVLREDKQLKSIYLIGQDYSFGQAVLREAKKQLAAQRPDVAVVGEELHPIGRVKDFAPYAVKIKTSGAQAVVTGNWGNDLTLLVKAAREVGYEGSFYTFYGNALGAPAAIGDAGIGKVVAVADWLPNVPGAQSEAFYQSFRTRFPKPQDDYVHMRMQLMVEALAQSIERAGSTDVVAIARQMESANVQLSGQGGSMRAADHQFQQALVVGVMDKKGAPGVKFDVEGSGYGFRVVRQIAAAKAQQPHSCQMQRY